jgi:hypothetical protein
LITSRQWHAYEEALKRSEAQWDESTQEMIERNPIPDIKINGKSWGDWEPRIIK